MSGGMDDGPTLEIPCPNCNELSSEPIERLFENDVIPCSLCAGLIDLNAENCRPLVDRARAHYFSCRTHREP